jgi:hypothetical protein
LGKNEAGPFSTLGATSWNKTAAPYRVWPVWEGTVVIGRMSAAALRGLFVALLVATPALMLPGVVSDSSQITVLVALIAFIMTFIEYNSNCPSIIEFRHAPPFNRMRFIALFLMVFGVSAMVEHLTFPGQTTGAITALATIVGYGLDFPYSPVRLAVLMVPDTASPQMVEVLRTGAGLAYFISIITIAAFVIVVRLLGWPTRSGAFNVWVNLPLFDPTSGGDVLYRLQRDSRLNITLGFLLPFLIPAVIKLAAPLMDPVTLDNPQTLIWTLTAWAFLPTSMIMRGIAMGKVANMILDKRRRVYASDEAALQAV